MRKVLHIGDEMEINKEREAFEAEFSKIKSDIAFWLHTWDEEMQGYNHPVMCWFWHMWQAKAQATPEGFVLVPKHHQQNIRDALVIACDVQEDEQRFEDSLNYVHKAMIEAQEQGHE